MRTHGLPWSVAFDATGNRIIASSSDGAVQMWDAPAFAREDAAAIAELAEVIAQSGTGEYGMWQFDEPQVNATRLARLREQAASDLHPPPDSFANFTRRFFAGYGHTNDTSRVSSR